VNVGAYAVASDTGRRRRRNEDNFVAAPPLFAVADGMGGAQAGEVASRLAASALEGGVDAALHGVERVAALIQEANRRVYERASNDPAASGMGTTMTVALVENGVVAIGHVGDSRAYLVRGGRMEQLTDDHSLVNELLKSGRLSPQEAEVHPQRSVITRAVGTDPEVEVDAFTIDTQEGDVFLLCSDGLTDMVGDVDILELVERNRDDLDRAVRSLVAAANRVGGEDNITAVAFRIADSPGEQTATLPVVPEPEEETVEAAAPPPRNDTMVIPPGQLEQQLGAGEEAGPGRPEGRRHRVRLVLAALVILAVAAVLLVWGLGR